VIEVSEMGWEFMDAARSRHWRLRGDVVGICQRKSDVFNENSGQRYNGRAIGFAR